MRERQQVIAAKELGEALVAGEDDAQQGARVELRGGEQAQLVHDRGGELLGLVDEQHRTQARGVEVGEPAGTQRLEAHPAVVGSEFDGEQVAELTVEVGEVGAGVGERGDGEVGQALEARGEQA